MYQNLWLLLFYKIYDVPLYSWKINNFNNNVSKCDHLQHMIKFWIIWNYIMVSATGIFFFAYIGICICDDEYDEYDDESDDLCPCC